MAEGTRYYLYFLNGATPASFCLFSFFSNTNFTEKTVDFSGIQTWIVGGEGEHTDHLTTTTAPTWAVVMVGFFVRLSASLPLSHPFFVLITQSLYKSCHGSISIYVDLFVHLYLQLSAVDLGANLIKHFTIVNYDARAVLTTNLPILRL